MDEKQLREEEQRLYKAMRELLDRQTEWTAEDETKWAELNAEYDSVRAKLEEMEQARARRQRLDEIQATIDGRGAFQGGTLVPADLTAPGAVAATAEEDRCLAVQGWIRSQLEMPLQRQHVEACERLGINPIAASLSFELFRGQYDPFRHALMARQQDTGTPSAGGYTVPETMVRELEIALLDFTGMRRVADVMRTTGGGPMPWPTTNDTANMGAIVAENALITNEDLVFGQIMFGAFKFSSLFVLLSQEMIEDNAVNLVGQLGRLLGERIGRKQNEQFTVGDGTTGPQGVTNAPTGHTAGSATVIDADDMIDLEHSVDPAYRANGCSWQLSDVTLAAVRKLKTGDGQYLLQPGMSAGAPNTILGYPYVINNQMPTAAANAKPVAFGQMAKYKIRDVAGLRLRRLVERFADNDQEGFVAFLRSDGRLLDAGTGPIKVLQMAAA